MNFLSQKFNLKQRIVGLEIKFWAIFCRETFYNVLNMYVKKNYKKKSVNMSNWVKSPYPLLFIYHSFLICEIDKCNDYCEIYRIIQRQKYTLLQIIRSI
jgi:hypothetical protein